jgi:hypothetical protein
MGGGDLNGPLVRSFLFYSYFFDTYSCYIVNIAYNLTNTSEKRGIEIPGTKAGR